MNERARYKYEFQNSSQQAFAKHSELHFDILTGTFDGAGCVADETLISALLAAYCCSNSSVVLDLKSPVKCKGSPKHDQAMSEECTQTLRIIISKTIFVKSSRSVQRQISNRHVLEMASNSPICALRRCGKRFKQLTPVTSEMNYCSFEKRD